MASVNGSVASSTLYGGWRVIPEYTVQETSTQVTITVTRVWVKPVRSGIWLWGLWSYGGIDGSQTMKVGVNTVTRDPIWPDDVKGAYWNTSYRYTYQKTKTQTTPKIAVSANLVNWGIADNELLPEREKRITSATSSATISVTVPSLATFEVTLNLDGGEGAATSLTKWYGEALTLPQPIKTGYTFAGWADSENPEAFYAPGDSYTANEAASLVAVWTPALTALNIIEIYAARDDGRGIYQDGVHVSASDDGTHVYVRGKWKTDGADAAALSTSLDMKDENGTVIDATASPITGAKPGTGELSYEGVFEWLASGANVEKRYFVNVGTTAQPDHAQETLTATRRELVSSAFFTMDVLAGGHGVSFGKPATRELFDVGMETNFDKSLNTLEDVVAGGDVSATGSVSGASLASDGGLSLFGGTALENMFTAVSINKTIGAVAGSSTTQLTFDVSLAGRKPIAISGWYVSGAAALYPYMLRLNGTNCQCYLRNPTSGASSATAEIQVQVLYVKNTI